MSKLPREFSQPVNAGETGGSTRAKPAPADMMQGPTANGGGVIVPLPLIDITVDRLLEQRRNPCAIFCNDYFGKQPKD